MFTVSDPGELIAAVPYVMGFCPQRSLLVMPVGASAADPSGLAPTIRIDLDVLGAVPPVEVADRLAQGLAGYASRRFALVVVGDGADELLPHEPAVHTVAARLLEHDVVVVEALFVAEISAGAAWRSYGDRHVGGQVPEPQSTNVAATLVASGVRAPYGSRDELAASLAPLPEDQRRATMALVEAKLDALLAQAQHDPTGVHRRALAALDDAVDAAVAGHLPESDDRRAELIAALGLDGMRDACLLPRSGDGAAERIEALWIALFRRADGALADELASLIAVSAYSRGDGTLARIAVGNASADHRLAHLVSRLLDLGHPPTHMREVMHQAARDTRDSLLGEAATGERA